MKTKLNDGECHTIHHSEDNMYAKCCMKLLLKDKQLFMVRCCDVTMSQPAVILEYSGSKFFCFMINPSNHTRTYHTRSHDVQMIFSLVTCFKFVVLVGRWHLFIGSASLFEASGQISQSGQMN